MAPLILCVTSLLVVAISAAPGLNVDIKKRGPHETQISVGKDNANNSGGGGNGDTYFNYFNVEAGCCPGKEDTSTVSPSRQDPQMRSGIV